MGAGNVKLAFTCWGDLPASADPGGITAGMTEDERRGERISRGVKAAREDRR